MVTSEARAQWGVTLTPMLDPRPIGLCGAVHITLVDSTGDGTPRNPLGMLMSLADFDMSVTSADTRAVAGQ
jgi:hypothetical protein